MSQDKMTLTFEVMTIDAVLLIAAFEALTLEEEDIGNSLVLPQHLGFLLHQLRDVCISLVLSQLHDKQTPDELVRMFAMTDVIGSLEEIKEIERLEAALAQSTTT